MWFDNRELKHQTVLVPRKYFCSMTATAHVKTFLKCGHGLQNASSQVETRGSNSGFFEEYSSYKSKNSSSEIMFSLEERNTTSRKKRHFQMSYSVGVRDGFTSVCLMTCVWRVNRVSDPVLRGQPCRS